MSRPEPAIRGAAAPARNLQPLRWNRRDCPPTRRRRPCIRTGPPQPPRCRVPAHRWNSCWTNANARCAAPTCWADSNRAGRTTRRPACANGDRWRMRPGACALPSPTSASLERAPAAAVSARCGRPAFLCTREGAAGWPCPGSVHARPAAPAASECARRRHRGMASGAASFRTRAARRTGFAIRADDRLYTASSCGRTRNHRRLARNGCPSAPDARDRRRPVGGRMRDRRPRRGATRPRSVSSPRRC